MRLQNRIKQIVSKGRCFLPGCMKEMSLNLDLEHYGNFFSFPKLKGYAVKMKGCAVNRQGCAVNRKGCAVSGKSCAVNRKSCDVSRKSCAEQEKLCCKQEKLCCRYLKQFLSKDVKTTHSQDTIKCEDLFYQNLCLNGGDGYSLGATILYIKYEVYGQLKTALKLYWF